MIVLIGSGGHAKVVLDALLAGGTPADAIRVRDGDPARIGARLFGIAIEGPELDPSLAGAKVHVAIGACATRARLYAELAALGAVPHPIVHPAATVAASATLAAGAFVAAGAVIGPSARIGRGAIVNHNAVVDHDCSVGDWCHVSPGAILGGAARIGEGVLVGAGAALLPGIAAGANAIVGAGAVVTRPVPAGETWAGVPAAPLNGHAS
jgi:sugar O-acyltransferase (sialic acid O-acetyltransferase NeuD family)